MSALAAMADQSAALAAHNAREVGRQYRHLITEREAKDGLQKSANGSKAHGGPRTAYGTKDGSKTDAICKCLRAAKGPMTAHEISHATGVPTKRVMSLLAGGPITSGRVKSIKYPGFLAEYEWAGK